jgi:hypothetical protein
MKSFPFTSMHVGARFDQCPYRLKMSVLGCSSQRYIISLRPVYVCATRK